jgi:uncharacterized membrane protein
MTRLFSLLFLGFALLVVGWVMLFIQVLRLLEPSFPLSFIGYGASLSGLIIGVIGIVHYRIGEPE